MLEPLGYKCKSPFPKHLKMMRFLFLCLLLLLPAATDGDDEDFATAVTVRYDTRGRQGPGSLDKTTGTDDSSAIILVRRNMRNRDRGIYYVPTEQEQKGTV
ncbi:hypothetical protein D9C73_016031 [Collichthys lucidus]|uniref:Uncharacterized protein n=1 Tax=Collichthys lucidus TaxID=240159 RepID=A0A4U5V2D3_COLLU|nr:hypothetical protein D9C73_016031 [Collichthys lucidus]